jgi:hypothetical protein
VPYHGRRHCTSMLLASYPVAPIQMCQRYMPIAKRELLKVSLDGARRTVTVAASAVVWARCMWVIVAPNIRARRSDVALVLIGCIDAGLADGFVWRRQGGGEGEKRGNSCDSEDLHDDGLSFGRNYRSSCCYTVKGDADRQQ